MSLRIWVSLLVIGLSGCASRVASMPGAGRPVQSGFAYVPLDPLPVRVLQAGDSRDEGALGGMSRQSLESGRILHLLPDNAVRVSVEYFDADGEVQYGPVGVGLRGHSYRITADYINADTANYPIRVIVNENWREGQKGTRYQVYAVVGSPNAEQEGDQKDRGYVYNIPVYVGIGLRVTADIRVLESGVVISGLGALGAQAAANELTGTLSVQTLGVNGRSISAALPIQSELNRTTAQNAIIAIGAVKALLYEEETLVTPRVVGMYLPMDADQELVNKIISLMSREDVPWRPPNPIEQLGG